MAKVHDNAIFRPTAEQHPHRAEQALRLVSVPPDAETDAAEAHRYKLPESQISRQPAWWDQLQGADLHLAHQLCASAC